MALVLRAKQDGFALPAAIAPGSPWADLTKTGDTFYRAPRKIASTRRTPQNCLRMIPLRSRSDSFTFTPGLSAIASESNFSRCPIAFFDSIDPQQTSALRREDDAE